MVTDSFRTGAPMRFVSLDLPSACEKIGPCKVFAMTVTIAPVVAYNWPQMNRHCKGDQVGMKRFSRAMTRVNFNWLS